MNFEITIIIMFKELKDKIEDFGRKVSLVTPVSFLYYEAWKGSLSGGF